jgi:hypothetical protein
MTKNGGIQIFVKMDLKCSTYGPEHKTDRFRSIEVIVNFWEVVEVGKNVVFDKNTYVLSGKLLKKSFNIQVFMNFIIKLPKLFYIFI